MTTAKPAPKPATLDGLVSSIYEAAGLTPGAAVPLLLPLSLTQDSGEFAKVPANGEVMRTVQVGGGAPFVWQGIITTGSAFAMKVEATQGNNLKFFRDYVESGCLFDSVHKRFLLPRPVFLNPDSALIVYVKDLSGAANRVHLAFTGYQPISG